jgi:hypothetical protein
LIRPRNYPGGHNQTETLPNKAAFGASCPASHGALLTACAISKISGD